MRVGVGVGVRVRVGSVPGDDPRRQCREARTPLWPHEKIRFDEEHRAAGFKVGTRSMVSE